MKFIYMSIVSAIFFFSCNEHKVDKIKSFIPGVYITTYANEYSKGNDTLIVTQLSKEGNNYMIKRNTTYQRVKGGKLLKPESKKQEWLCIYNEGERVLREVKEGRVISFIPEKNELLVGNTEYYKIK